MGVVFTHDKNDRHHYVMTRLKFSFKQKQKLRSERARGGEKGKKNWASAGERKREREAETGLERRR